MFYLDGWNERSPSGSWSPPRDLIERRIDAFNGELANEWCPVTQREWFKPGTEPTDTCREHEAPLLDRLEELGRKLGKALERILGEL
jgi:membrane carboxypeptidase/penicillin-binding protein